MIPWNTLTQKNLYNREQGAVGRRLDIIQARTQMQLNDAFRSGTA